MKLLSRHAIAFTAFIAFLACAMPYGIAEEPATDEIHAVVADIEARLVAVTTIRASFTETLYAGKAQNTAEIKLVYKKPFFYKVEINAQGVEGADSYFVFSDGDVHWAYVPAQKKAYKTDLIAIEKKLGTGKLKELLDSGPHTALGRLAKDSMRYEGSESYAGKDVYVITGECVADLQKPPYRIMRARLRIDKTTGLLVKMEGYDLAGQKVFVEEYRTCEVNIDIPPDTFVFTPAADETVEDVTSGRLAELQ